MGVCVITSMYDYICMYEYVCILLCVCILVCATVHVNTYVCVWVHVCTYVYSCTEILFEKHYIKHLCGSLGSIGSLFRKSKQNVFE